MLNLGLNVNNQILPDLGAPAASGVSKDQSNASDSLADQSFQDLLQGKLKPTSVKLDSKAKGEPETSLPVDDKLGKDSELETPVAVTPQMPQMPVEFPVNKEDIAPMQQFLQRIETEAGVTPDAWADAMLKLNPEEQLKTPWDTAKAVVAQLEIPGDKKQTVIKAYDKLLGQLQAVDAAKADGSEEISTETLIALAPMMAAAASLKESSKSQAEVPALNSNIPKSSTPEKLAAGKEVAAKREIPVNGKTVVDNVSSAQTGFEFDLGKVSEGQNLDQAKINIDELKSKIEAIPVDVKSKAQPVEIGDVKFDSAANVETPVENALNFGQTSQSTSEAGADESLTSQFFADDKKFDRAEALSSNSSENFEGARVQNYKKLDLSDFKADTKSGGKKSELMSFSSKPETSSGDGAEIPQFFIDNSQVTASREMPLRAESLGSAAAGMAGVQLAEDANAAELIRQAQFMIRQGGGEVRIKLNPENLGEVNMKMSVDGDKVQLALDTTTQEAKKLIESSINELRATLSANKLSLETVKVDVAGKSDNQFTNHRHDSDGGAAREQARQFMNNFREENQSRRSAMSQPMDVPRSAPRPAVTAASRNPYSRGYNASGRLNLVA